MKSATFILNADTPWIVSPDEPEPIQRALRDLQNDWYDVMGHLPIILADPPDWRESPVLYLGTAGAGMRAMIGNMPPSPEGYLVRFTQDMNGRDCIIATGVDLRGVIYAIYAVSEHILGVDPWYFWIDKRVPFRGRVEVDADLNILHGPSTFRWRGWFINDEDLLNGFAPDPSRENVFSLDLFDKIYETLLRLRGNMVAPATFPFPDERCQELASRRGLVLHMHHILALGLNTSRWPASQPYSYLRAPGIIEAHWRTCMEVFKDREVLWTLGFRGKQDRPFWKDDTEASQLTDAEKGAMISRVIARQAEMVRDMQPEAPMIANLFMEGNDLYRAGHLKLPDGVIPVWADLGNGVIGDHGAVRQGDGVYYHTAMMNNRANQLTEMTGPERIFRELGRFVEAGATEYLLLNLSDIRPVPLSSDCVMAVARDAVPWMRESSGESGKKFLVDWSTRVLDPDCASEAGSLYARYFLTEYMHDEAWTRGEHFFCSWILNFHARCFLPLIREGSDPFAAFGEILKCRAEYPRPQDNTVYDGGTPAEAILYAARAIEHFEPLAGDIEALLPKLAESRRNFFRTHLFLQVRLHLNFARLLKSYATGVVALAGKQMEAAKANFLQGIELIDQVAVLLREGEEGCWRGWYRGEKFVCFADVRDFLRQVIAIIKGTPFPLARRRTRYEETPVAGKRRIRDEIFSERVRYEMICDYQDPFAENYPLLYGTNESPADV